MTAQLVDNVQIIDPVPIPVDASKVGVIRPVSELTPQETVMESKLHFGDLGMARQIGQVSNTFFPEFAEQPDSDNGSESATLAKGGVLWALKNIRHTFNESIASPTIHTKENAEGLQCNHIAALHGNPHRLGKLYARAEVRSAPVYGKTSGETVLFKASSSDKISWQAIGITLSSYLRTLYCGIRYTIA